MSRINAQDFLALMQDVCKKFNVLHRPLDLTGLVSRWPVDEADISKRYLDTARKKVEDEHATSIAFRDDKLKLVVNLLGFDSYHDYLDSKKAEAGSTLNGNWYSIALSNSRPNTLLVSPVMIDGAQIRLKALEREFEGKVLYEGHKVFVTLRSDDGQKQLSMVFNTGSHRKPQLLKGTFCGIGSGGHPIAGRELLLRVATDFSSLENQQLHLNEAAVHRDKQWQLIAQYFAKDDCQAIRVELGASFDLPDLEWTS